MRHCRQERGRNDVTETRRGKARRDAHVIRVPAQALYLRTSSRLLRITAERRTGHCVEHQRDHAEHPPRAHRIRIRGHQHDTQPTRARDADTDDACVHRAAGIAVTEGVRRSSAYADTRTNTHALATPASSRSRSCGTNACVTPIANVSTVISSRLPRTTRARDNRVAHARRADSRGNSRRPASPGLQRETRVGFHHRQDRR